MAESEKTSFKRPINMSESLDTNISFYSDLQCKQLTKGMIYQALTLLRQHHPYFRLCTKTMDDKIWLVEEETGDIPLVWIEGIIENWEDELVSFANQSRDHSVSLTFIQCRYNNQGRYQLFGAINHIAIDGLGFAEALHTFYNYLGEMSLCENYKTVSLADRRPFIDVFARNPIIEPHIFNFTHDYLLPQEPHSDESITQSTNPSSKAQIIGLFKKFDQETTTKLLANAKIHSTTVQGMLSVAALITSIWIRKIRPELPVWTMNWCATNLRSSARPPVNTKDCVFATAPLVWEQQVEQHLCIWSLAQDASYRLHKHNNQLMGWQFLDAKKYSLVAKPPTVVACSSGKLQIGTHYGNMKVMDLRVMTANYDGLPIDTVSHMNYIYIYDQQLHLITIFSYPGLSKQWGKRFHNGVTYILESFAMDSELTIGSILEILDEKDRDLQPRSLSSSFATPTNMVSSV